MEVLRVILGTVFIVGIIALVVLLTMMAYSLHKINELEKLKKKMAENPNYYKDKEFLRKIKKYRKEWLIVLGVEEGGRK